MLTWLKDEPRSIKDCAIVALKVLWYNALATTFFVMPFTLIWKIFAALPTKVEETSNLIVSEIVVSPSKAIGLLFILAAVEELIFRGIPLFVCVRLGRALAPDHLSYILVFVCLLSATIFGWVHGGIYHVFVQGLGGLFFSVLFLKCGGWRGAFFKPLLVSSFAHFAWNSVILAGVLVNVFLKTVLD